MAKELIKRGATVDLRGSSNTTPLMFAAACEQAGTARGLGPLALALTLGPTPKQAGTARRLGP